MASSTVLARIHAVWDNQTIPWDVQPLQIGGNDIKLFRDVLLEQMQLRETRSGWWLEFFMQTGHVQRFYVNFVPADNLDNERAHPRQWSAITSLAYTALEKQRDGSVNAADLLAACEETSLLVRGSRATKPAHLYEASTHLGFVDGRGAQYISKGSGLAQFERHVLLHALAYAYLLTMEQLSDRLSIMLQGQGSEGELRSLYKAVALFNAKSFFHQPVKLSNGATCEAWKRIDQALGIRTSNTELIKQIESAHHIYNLEAEQQAAQQAETLAKQEKESTEQEAADQARRERKEKRRDLGLTLVGLLLALVSAPGAIDLVKAWL